MIRFSAFSHNKRDVTQSASVSLPLVQYQPLFLGGFPSHLLFLALHPVLVQSWVIGRIPPCDFCEAGDWGCIGFDQCRLLLKACPGAIAPKGARFHPCTAFVRVSAFRPVPKHLPLGMSNFCEDVLGRRVPGVVRPSSHNGVEIPHDLPCRGLLMCVQVGSYRPHMFEDFFLLWDGQQCSLPAPAFPDMESQDVQPFLDMDYPGFGFAEWQSSILEELLQSWSGVGFQYFPGRSRGHKVLGVSNNRHSFVGSFAQGWGFGSSIRPCSLAQPFHPLQCHVCPQWGTHSALWRARVRWREEADFDHSCLQPLAECALPLQSCKLFFQGRTPQGEDRFERQCGPDPEPLPPASPRSG